MQSRILFYADRRDDGMLILRDKKEDVELFAVALPEGDSICCLKYLRLKQTNFWRRRQKRFRGGQIAAANHHFPENDRY